MFQFFANFFREGTSESMMRLLSFMCVLTACVISISMLFVGKDLSVLVGILLGAGITGKAVQKLKEPDLTK